VITVIRAKRGFEKLRLEVADEPALREMWRDWRLGGKMGPQPLDHPKPYD